LLLEQGEAAAVGLGKVGVAASGAEVEEVALLSFVLGR
jgi:hypothetical protein